MTLNEFEDNLVANVFPLGMQNSELVLQDEEGNSVVTELDELSNVSEQNISPAAINIENSCDVIIGPVTQFHGPVTISVNGHPAIEQGLGTKNSCQLNGKLVKSESSSSDTSHGQEKPKGWSPKHLKYIAISIAVVFIIVLIACAVILSSKIKHSKQSVTTDLPPLQPPTEDTNHSEDGKALAPILPGSIIERQMWHAHRALNGTKPLKHPTPLVVISHTVTPTCETFEKCASRVRSIQEFHINDMEYPDIGYNFLIGGDANIYVGRGWDVRNFHSNNSIGISFIGNYIEDELTEGMINSTKKLLEEGVKLGKLSEDYKLIRHSQIYNTLSPGRNVYKIIKTWPHFDPRTYKKT